MKQLYAGFAGIFFMVTLQASADDAEKPANFESNRAMSSYALGVQTARTLSKDGVDIDVDQYINGIKDQSSKQKLLLTDEELRKVLNGIQAELRRNAKKSRAMAGVENINKGTSFLNENKKKPGVITLPSGVQYLVIKEGKGRVPLETDTVECHYRGTLIDGTQFDATEPGKPASLKVLQLVPGMREALKLMPVGSHWEIVIPSNLAYGQRAVGTEIGPNSTLVFDLELVSIK